MYVYVYVYVYICMYVRVYIYIVADIFPNINDKARMSTLTSPIPHYSVSLRQYNKARKKNTMHTDWNERNKTVSSHRRHDY